MSTRPLLIFCVVIVAEASCAERARPTPDVHQSVARGLPLVSTSTIRLAALPKAQTQVSAFSHKTPSLPQFATDEPPTLTGWVDSHVPSDLLKITTTAAKFSKYYQQAQTIYNTINVFLTIIGLVSSPSSPSIQTLINQVEADIDAAYAGIVWETQTIAWGGLVGDVAGPISVAQAYYNEYGNDGQAACPLPDTAGCGTPNALGAFATLSNDYSVLFGRPYNATAVAGSWQSILATTRNADTGTLTSAFAAPIMPGTNWVFDWRVGLPATMQFVEQLMQIYPLTDPNFENDSVWGTTPGGMQQVREFLEQIYTTMVQGTHTDYMCNYKGADYYCAGYNPMYAIMSLLSAAMTPEAPSPNATMVSTRVVAADINTGIQVTVPSFTPATFNNSSCSLGAALLGQPYFGHFISDVIQYVDPNCTTDVENDALAMLYGEMPLSDLRAMIDELAAMQRTGIETSLMPSGVISDCQSVADQYGIVQDSTYGSATSSALQRQWQMSGCSSRASWLDEAWQVRSSRVALDYNNDDIGDLGYFQPETSGWRPLSGNAVGSPTLTGPIPSIGQGAFYSSTDNTAHVWGSSTAVPVPGRYEGFGRAAILTATWQPQNGYWYLSSSQHGPFSFQWGAQGDIPVPEDYDGDGIDDLAVWRPSNGIWYIQFSNGTAYAYTGGSAYTWGQVGDVPVPADYDDDGKTDIAVWEPSTGIWFLNQSHDGATAIQWGQTGDIPVPFDYEGTGRANLAVFRPAEGGWYILSADRTQGSWVGWGQIGDIPVPGDYDGDGRVDIAVFRPSEGNWYILYSNFNYSVTQFGPTGVVPVP